jgi:predicted ester cyclase
VVFWREAQVLNKDDAMKLANEWVAAWNTHDLERILAHYEESVELISPVAARLLGRPEGKVVGKSDLRAYFQRGLESFPDLHFSLQELFFGLNSMVLLYANHKGARVGEFMELSPSGKVVRVVANYST